MQNLWQKLLIILSSLFTASLVFAVYIFQDNILINFLKPKAPFQVLEKPAEPDYENDKNAWLLPKNFPNQLPEGSVYSLQELEYIEPINSKLADLPPIDNKQTKQTQADNKPQTKSKATSSLAVDASKISKNITLKIPPYNKTSKADFFYITDTAYFKNDNWNSDFSDPELLQIIKNVNLPHDIGFAFSNYNVFIPNYRQASLGSFFTTKFDGLAASELATQDVLRAFEKFLNSSNPQRPLILYGVGQGGLMLQKILLTFFTQNNIEKYNLQNRLVAALIINRATPLDFIASNNIAIPLCLNQDMTACLISFHLLPTDQKKEQKRIKQRLTSFIGSDGLTTNANHNLICINPLSWESDTKETIVDMHKGAAFTHGLNYEILTENPDYQPIIKSKLFAPFCQDGLLLYDEINNKQFSFQYFWGKKWKKQKFNLLYEDLASNLLHRTNIVNDHLKEIYVPPFNKAHNVTLDTLPINKITK